MRFTKNDEAASEVIGAILMVALVVTLAGVVAAFIFGMPADISKPKSVTATAVKLSAYEIEVTYTGGKDSGLVETVSWRVTPDAPPDDTFSMGTAGSILQVGTSHVFTKSPRGYSQESHVVGFAHFSDNTDQVIIDIRV